jgi:hypothetical protein
MGNTAYWRNLKKTGPKIRVAHRFECAHNAKWIVSVAPSKPAFLRASMGSKYNQRRYGGESGIRTHVRVSPKHAFQACAFSHSAISPATNLRSENLLQVVSPGRLDWVSQSAVANAAINSSLILWPDPPTRQGIIRVVLLRKRSLRKAKTSDEGSVYLAQLAA